MTASDSVSPQIRAALGAQRAYRARAENEAVQRFRGLAARLRAHAVGSELCELAATAAEDEERHRHACDLEAQRWGADAHSFRPVHLPTPSTGESPRQKLEFEVITLCCVAESLNSIYLSEIVCDAEDEGLRERTRTILKDEVQHARLGWHFLKDTGADVSWLSDHMPRIFGATLHEELAGATGDTTTTGADSLTSKRHGIYSASQLLALWTASLREVVLPGLVDHGLDAAPALAWLESRQDA